MRRPATGGAWTSQGGRDVSWFQVSDARLVYAGRIDRAPFAAWLGTAEGTKAIDAVASRLGFRLLGRQRAARREVWGTLRRAAGSEPLRTALGAAADAYMAAMIEIAYAAGLPRTQVALRRVVVVPRVMIADRARTRVSRQVLRSPGLPEVDEAIRAFFLDELIIQMDEGIRRARPSPSRPIGAPEQWTCVGVETTYPWVDPYWSGPNWFGHVFLYEWPPAGLARRDRKFLEGAIVELQSAINTLPRQRRHELVRAAAIA